MKKVFVFTVLLLIGLIFSQTLLPSLAESIPEINHIVVFLTYTGLAYIMFFVGLEFHLKKNELGAYKTDYIVAFTAATFPWIFVALYFLVTHYPSSEWFAFETWKEILFVGRFAAPTSAGILFAMLAAAGLAGTWIYEKIRVLAIFDDLDTVLLLIPLKIMVIGMAWQLGVILLFMLSLVVLAWVFLRKLNLPIHGYYPLIYSVAMSGACYGLYLGSKVFSPDVPIHLEVLFPAFVFGLMISLNKKKEADIHDGEKGLAVVGGIFMLLVGLNMPYVWDELSKLSASGWMTLGWHVLMVTLVSNIGKLFVLFKYTEEATFRQRLAVGVGMLPRGEVGAGVLVMAIGLGFSGPIVTIAMASLILNLMLTGIFILIVKKLAVEKDLAPLGAVNNAV